MDMRDARIDAGCRQPDNDAVRGRERHGNAGRCRKLASGMLLALVLTGSPALVADSAAGQPGQGSPGGGFTGPGPALMTVEQARELRDDAKVSIRGNIIQHLGGDEYLFRDKSGSITVEINHRIWEGRNIGPSDTVTIHGEIDKEWTSTVIDVDRIALP